MAYLGGKPFSGLSQRQIQLAPPDFKQAPRRNLTKVARTRI